MGPMPITDEMKKIREDKIAKMCDKINTRIQKAVEAGECTTYFPCDKSSDKDIYDEVRAKYENVGYTIKPTGYIGGIWQLTEDICW